MGESRGLGGRRTKFLSKEAAMRLAMSPCEVGGNLDLYLPHGMLLNIEVNPRDHAWAKDESGTNTELANC